MTPHDSTRCACGHSFYDHATNGGGMCIATGDCPCHGFAPTLPTAGVGAVDAAVAWGVMADGATAVAAMRATEGLAQMYADMQNLGTRDNPYRVIPLYTTPPRSPATVTEAMVTAGINALDDVSGDKGLSMGRRERVRAILTAALRREDHE